MAIPQSFETEQSIQALDRNRFILAENGYSVQSGCEVTINTGTLGSGNSTLSVSSGTVLENFSEVSVSSGGVDIPASNSSFPRKDVVIYDVSAASFDVVQGTAEEAQPQGDTRETAEKPAPPDFDTSVDNLSTGTDPYIPLAEIWIPEGADSITSNDVFDRRTAPTNATSIGGLELDEFASQRRTFDIDVTGQATDSRILIGKISDGTVDEDGKFVATVYNAVGTGNIFTSSLTLNCGVRQSSETISHYYYGIKAGDNDDNVGLVVTESAGTGANGNDEYWLYVDPAQTTDATLVVEHADSFGNFNYTEGLTTADYNGSAIYETKTQDSTMDVEFGEVDMRRISGLITGNTDISNLDGNSLSIDGSGNFNLDTEVNRMSYYTSGGVADTEFDTAVADTPAGETLLLDVDIELTQQHDITKAITIEALDHVTLTCSNSTNNDPHIFFLGGGIQNTTTTTAATQKSDRVIPVTDETIFSAGDRILIMSEPYTQTVDAQIHFDEVESTSTGQITLQGGLHQGFDSGEEIYQINLLDQPTIKNVDTTGGGNRHLQFRWCEEPVFDNVSVNEYLEVSMYFSDSWKPRSFNCEATNPTGLASGEGEPIVFYRCQDGYCESPRVYDCRRGVDFAWGSHQMTVVDPVIHGVSLNGISTHGNDTSGHISIQGGEIICDPNGQTGNGITMSDMSTFHIDGVRIVARERGIIASGECSITNCKIEATPASSNPLAAIQISHGNVKVDDCLVEDPDGVFDFGIWIDGSGTSVSGVDVDCDINRPGVEQMYVDGRSGPVSDVKLRGRIDNLGGTSSQGILVRADAGNRVENIDISVEMLTFDNQCVRLLAEDSSGSNPGVLDNVNVHDSYFDAGLAAVFSDGVGTFETMRVANCSMDTGSTSISFNETINKLFITNNDVSGSIDSTGGANSTVTGNL